MWGVRRGLFSNEAGQGSAPIAHATAKTTEPVREGLVASLGPFIDTLVICTMTGLVIVTSGAYKDKVEQDLSSVTALEAVVAQSGASDADLLSLRESRRSGAITVRDGVLQGGRLVHMDALVENARLRDGDGRPWSGTLQLAADGGISVDGASPSVLGNALHTGAELTSLGFTKGLGGAGQLIVTLAVLLFAVSTAISWSYYGDRSTEYILGSRFIPIYRWIFVFFFFLGGILPLRAVWIMGDVALGLMSFPNLIALVLLAGAVVGMSKDYFSREHKPYK